MIQCFLTGCFSRKGNGNPKFRQFFIFISYQNLYRHVLGSFASKTPAWPLESAFKKHKNTLCHPIQTDRCSINGGGCGRQYLHLKKKF